MATDATFESLSNSIKEKEAKLNAVVTERREFEEKVRRLRADNEDA